MTVCPYCDQSARLVDGLWVYPHRPDLKEKMFWMCDPCDAWVGCHKAKKKGGRGDGTIPLGRLANSRLRKLKQEAHKVFDPLWKNGPFRNRTMAYRWLAQQLKLSYADCHIGMFDDERCLQVIEIVKGHYADVVYSKSNTRKPRNQYGQPRRRCAPSQNYRKPSQTRHRDEKDRFVLESYK